MESEIFSCLKYLLWQMCYSHVVWENFSKGKNFLSSTIKSLLMESIPLNIVWQTHICRWKFWHIMAKFSAQGITDLLKMSLELNAILEIGERQNRTKRFWCLFFFTKFSSLWLQDWGLYLLAVNQGFLSVFRSCLHSLPPDQFPV